jgi:hypothetical protein
MSTLPEERMIDGARANALEPLYAEVCKVHGAITDFRGKLLALVPTLSGAAFTLIIGTRKDFDQWLLLPSGFLVRPSPLAFSATSCAGCSCVLSSRSCPWPSG